MTTYGIALTAATPLATISLRDTTVNSMIIFPSTPLATVKVSDFLV